MSQAFSIVIPMAGWATRLRPQTWSKPKPLVSVAGKTTLAHTLDMFKTLPQIKNAEFVFIVDPFLGKSQISQYMQEHYPELTVHYTIQSEMKGQSHALWMARDHLSGPTLMVFSDTLIKTDFSFLENEILDGVAWVKPVPDPRRFGVAEVSKDGLITRMIEKPDSMNNNLALVGCYFFAEGKGLAAAIEEQLTQDINLHGEYYLVDAVNMMIAGGSKMRTEQTDIWVDTGTVAAALETNAFLLANGHSNADNFSKPDVKIIHPTYIHPSAQVKEAVIGPNTSIGPDCKIDQAVIQNSIIEEGAQITRVALAGSFIGRNCLIIGQSHSEKPVTINIGDDSLIRM
ncbi:MAG: hypothetical protein JXA13_10345 [Anaerolineales bacterium]|nr:hypothetical protein [Anaerolineales bacterium]